MRARRGRQERRITITGSGFPDLGWAHLVATAAGGMNKVQRIWRRSTYNADDFGVALAEHHGVGLTMAEFESDIAAADKMSDHERTKIIEIGNFNPVPSWNANGWLCARFGLSVTRQVQLCTPIVHDRPLYSKTLGHEIKIWKRDWYVSTRDHRNGTRYNPKN
jgi:2,4-diaminopentanoate dehydrogenase